MPIYIFNCEECGQERECFSPTAQMAEDYYKEQKCQKCGSRMVYKVSSPGLSFKGGGWTNKHAEWGDQK